MLSVLQTTTKKVKKVREYCSDIQDLKIPLVPKLPYFHKKKKTSWLLINRYSNKVLGLTTTIKDSKKMIH